MRIAIIGLGLIGGSLAKAISRYTEHYVLGVDNSEETLDAALLSGAVKETSKTLPKADIYFLATAPKTAIEILKNNAEDMPKGAIVTDVCGVKRTVTYSCEEICLKNSLRFVGGHPMAGREVSGFTNSDYDLFKNRSYIITTTENTDKSAVDILEKLVVSIGIDTVTYTTPEHHDRMIAFTSQLPHILAGAYMKSPASREHNGYSAGSYHDVSRVSSVDENLWSELFITNKEDLQAELEILIDNLNKYLVALKNIDKEELKRLVKESRILKENDLHKNGVEKPHQFG